MSEISKAALAEACEEKVKQLEFSVKQSAFDSVRQELETELQIARVALAALREQAEPVAWTEKCEITNMQATGLYLRGFPDSSQGRDIPLYTAPPAP
ncbi:hypothetical protein SMX70_004629, partial [Cronobacter sakazakii]|nr:hypothetical protein [Cronobacter sakazakii]